MQSDVTKYRKGLQLLEKELTNVIIAIAIEAHRELGPGLLESAHQLCMEHERALRKLPVEHQVPLKVKYKGLELDGGYRIDLLFDKRVVRASVAPW